MDLETCMKYLNFVSEECDRHLSDGKVTDEELLQLIIEFQRFQDNARESVLPDVIKTKIAEIQLKYTRHGVERSSMDLFLGFITLGIYAVLISMRKQVRRKQTLNALKFDSSRVASFIQLQY